MEPAFIAGFFSIASLVIFPSTSNNIEHYKGDYLVQLE